MRGIDLCNGPPPWIVELRIMLVKSLVVSVAAALLGPTLGIATFFLANSNYSGLPFSASVEAMGLLLAQPDDREVVTPSGAWYGPSAQERRLDTAATAQPSVVNCPEGQALSENGRCWSSSIPPPT
jgi:hypothetical protein